MIGTCDMQAHEEGGESNTGGHMEEGIGAPGACCVGEHVVVRALGGDGPLFMVADFLGGIRMYPPTVRAVVGVRGAPVLDASIEANEGLQFEYVYFENS